MLADCWPQAGGALEAPDGSPRAGSPSPPAPHACCGHRRVHLRLLLCRNPQLQRHGGADQHQRRA
ncbi:MAG: hypothetical protein ACLT98_12640 [Eggerthellaceae bacterium]